MRTAISRKEVSNEVQGMPVGELPALRQEYPLLRLPRRMQQPPMPLQEGNGGLEGVPRERRCVMTHEQKHEHRVRNIALRLFVITRKKRSDSTSRYIPTISWNELNVPFQDIAVMDLRQMGVLRLSGDGVMLDQRFADMSTNEFQEYIKERRKQ